MVEPRHDARLGQALAAVAAIEPGSDRRSAERTVSRHLMSGGSSAAGRWLVGSGEYAGSPAYGLAAVHVLGGLPTEAVLVDSLDSVQAWAALGDGAAGPEGPIRLDSEYDGPKEVTISLGDDRTVAQVAARLQSRGYRAVARRRDAFSVLAVLRGTSAGFVADRTEPATRLAAALLVAEARGRACHWSGLFPACSEESLLVARDPAGQVLLAGSVAGAGELRKNRIRNATY